MNSRSGFWPSILWLRHWSPPSNGSWQSVCLSMSNESAKAEVHSAFHHFAWAKVIVLGVNTLVVAYLFFHLVNKRRRACTRWEAQAAALSRHHAVIRLSAFLLLCIG